MRENVLFLEKKVRKSTFSRIIFVTLRPKKQRKL